GVPLHERSGAADARCVWHADEGPLGPGAHVHQHRVRVVLEHLPGLAGGEVSGVGHRSSPFCVWGLLGAAGAVAAGGAAGLVAAGAAAGGCGQSTAWAAITRSPSKVTDGEP